MPLIFPRGSLGLAAVALLSSTALAEQVAPAPASVFYVEGDFMPKEQDYYGTLVTALNGNIGSSGPLFRLEGSLYDFNYNEYAYGWKTRIEGKQWRGTSSLGYQYVANDIYYNLFTGVDYQSINLSPNDRYNSVRGDRTGVKASAVIVSGLTQPLYFEFIPSYSTAFDRYFVRLRAGPTFLEGSLIAKFTIGPEITWFGDVNFDTRRLGVFLIFPVEIGAFGGLVVTASTGYQWVSLRSDGSGEGGASGAYGMVGFAVSF